MCHMRTILFDIYTNFSFHFEYKRLYIQKIELYWHQSRYLINIKRAVKLKTMRECYL